VALKAMTAGREVVEDYGHVGLTLRAHPVAFLRADLAHRRILTCAEATAKRDGALVRVAGLVLIRQRPGSAKGVMFITIEDESGIANIVVWPDLFERERRTILAASLLGVEGRIQREGEVVHVVARRLGNLADLFANVAQRDGAHLQMVGQDDGGRPDNDPCNRLRSEPEPPGVSILQSQAAIKVRSRDFR
jgi:error-prone DNA polymerase